MAIKKPKDLAKILAEKLVIEDNNLTLDDETFYGNAPEGITKDTIALQRGYEATFAAASAMALNGMAKDVVKDHDLVTLSYGMGDGVKGSVTAMRDPESKNWTAHTTIERNLGDNDVYAKCQQDLLKTLNSLKD